MRSQLFCKIFILLNAFDLLCSQKPKIIKNENSLINMKNAEIRSKAKDFIVQTINQNYMYTCLICSVYLLVMFLFLINCIWVYWDILFLKIN